MNTSALLANTTSVRAGKVGAWYDLFASVAFVTPWSAAAVFGLLQGTHTAWDLPGNPLTTFDGTQMMFVNLFGAAVTMWSIARIVLPVPWTVMIDTAGRLVFSLTFVKVLLQGHSTVLIPFLVLEVAFLVWQAVGVRGALRSGTAGVAPGSTRLAPAARPEVVVVGVDR